MSISWRRHAMAITSSSTCACVDVDPDCVTATRNWPRAEPSTATGLACGVAGARRGQNTLRSDGQAFHHGIPLSSARHPRPRPRNFICSSDAVPSSTITTPASPLGWAPLFRPLPLRLGARHQRLSPGHLPLKSHVPAAPQRSHSASQ